MRGTRSGRLRGARRVLRRIVLAAGLPALALIWGCSGAVQPYSSKFSCPPTYAGLCEPVKQAYLDSKHDVDPRMADKKWLKMRREWEEKNKDLMELRRKAGEPVEEISVKGHESGNETAGAGEIQERTVDEAVKEKPGFREPAQEYREELFRDLRMVIKEPDKPMVIPPRVVRILVLATEARDTGERTLLIAPHYVYFMLDTPRWLFSKVPEYFPADLDNPLLRRRVLKRPAAAEKKETTKKSGQAAKPETSARR